ncbi:MAG: glucosidase [Cyanophyceae cyanobacterium]
MNIEATQEGLRLVEDRNRMQYWKRWGPYVSDRAWGTVREDYSADGNAWAYFPHDQARSRAYRWGEDGIAGICDNHQRLCLAIALWNGIDPILKERLFGLTNTEGNHGEDVKEYYFYLDNTPTHSYMKFLYKYPQAPFPYTELVAENKRRKATNPQALEFELLDTRVFEGDRYFDVVVEYAKHTPEDIVMQIAATNRGPERHTLHVLPTLWFRNTWSWGYEQNQPWLKEVQVNSLTAIEAYCAAKGFGTRWLYCDSPQELLYTNNETNFTGLAERFPEFAGANNASPYVKDGINDYIIHGRPAVNPNRTGTKACASYQLDLAPGATQTVRLRLSDARLADPFGEEFARVLQTRQQEADQFYQAVTPSPLSPEQQRVQRQAFAGLLWTKQFYHYVVQDWLQGDPATPPPPIQRKQGRNHRWTHLFNEDIISMPDKWEYPWYAAWDLAFHTVPLALVDPDFAKRQLYLFTREWYMHPNGQIPAYEWAFGDVNPPVHAWAAWQVYELERQVYGRGDRAFLEEVFQKLALYFTWWVNRKDAEGNNLFEGGFLGLDNIGVFDRSHLNIPGATIEQSDGTSWMGMYCLNLLKMAAELAKDDPTTTYEDMASKFFQHFLLIADSLNHRGSEDINIWNEEEQFYYDILRVPRNTLPGGNEPFAFAMKLRSMVGLIPLFAVEAIDGETLSQFTTPDFQARFDWFLNNRPDLTEHGNISLGTGDRQNDITFALVSPQRLRALLTRMLDEAEFLSPYGIRALSKIHAPDQQPYRMPFAVQTAASDSHGNRIYVQPEVFYEPAESQFGLFGGNSNWRGPVWFPVNYLLVESLRKFHRYLGDDFKIECPTGSGTEMTLADVAEELSKRLIDIFLPDSSGGRPVYGGTEQFRTPDWRELMLFYEYFHGDNGAGIGASHQTGWTGMVASLIWQRQAAGTLNGPH